MNETTKVEAVRQEDGGIFIFTVSKPDPRFTDKDGRQYQEAFQSEAEYTSWKAKYPGLSDLNLKS